MKYLALLFVVLAFVSCKNDAPDDKPDDQTTLTDNTNVLGYGILSKWPGIWNGPVSSTTPLGSYPEWIVDFRPIAGAQVSGKAELDTVNDIFMSFFLTKYDGKYLMAFRNGGGFAGQQRVSYQIIDSVRETATESYYRFSDVKAGENRVYAEFVFRTDSVHMQVYTNKYNTVSPPVLHMQWHAKRMDNTSTANATQHFAYPKKQLVKDLSTAFDGLTEAVYYGTTNDPYKQEDHPYLGETTITATLGAGVNTTTNGQVVLLLTTQPLFNGLAYQPGNLKYRSRYVLLKAAPYTYAFDYMHPSTYYLNAFYDSNGDLNPNSGEYIAYPFDQAVTLAPEGQATSSAAISFEIP